MFSLAACSIIWSLLIYRVWNEYSEQHIHTGWSKSSFPACISYYKVIIGKRRPKGAASPEMPSLKEGDMCLLNVPKYSGEWPQVAKIVQLEMGTALVHWFGGSKTSRWSPCTIPAPGERGKRIARTENVLVEHIWFYGFSFTPSRHLPSSVKTKIESFTDFWKFENEPWHVISNNVAYRHV